MLNLTIIRFEFTAQDSRVYSANWHPKGSIYYSDFAASKDHEKNAKYEVTIHRGGGYKVSYYTDNAANKTNSIELIERYLKTARPVS